MSKAELLTSSRMRQKLLPVMSALIRLGEDTCRTSFRFRRIRQILQIR
jgi:hypothetical protein